MGSITLIVSILLALSFLLAPCDSEQLNHSKPLQQVDHATFSQPSLPRKLTNLNYHKTNSAEEHFKPHHKFGQLSSDSKQEEDERAMNAAGKEAMRSEYFTMDYGWVRRRRPIHNKQVPFTP